MLAPFQSFARPSGFDGLFALMDELTREPFRGSLPPRGPLCRVADTAEAWIVTADLPGAASDDVKLTLDDGVLTIEASRDGSAPTPDGYRAVSRERCGFELSRSFALPTHVDAERTTADLVDGVLTLTLPKAPETQPRTIAVTSR